MWAQLGEPRSPWAAATGSQAGLAQVAESTVASREGSACVQGTWERDGHASKQSAGSGEGGGEPTGLRGAWLLWKHLPLKRVNRKLTQG